MASSVTVAKSQTTASATAAESAQLEELPKLPFNLNVTSPFSETWGQYQLKPEIITWRKAEEGRVKGRWVRSLWGGELYQERRASATNRGDDMVTSCTLALPATMERAKFLGLFRLACMTSRFWHPIMAVTIETGIFNIPLLPCYLYDEVTSFAKVEAWANRAIFVHEPSPEEASHSMKQRVEAVRAKIGQRPLVVSECAKEWHLVLSDHADDSSMVCIMTYCAHTVSDAHAEMLSLRQQLELVVELAKAPYPVPSTHALHPAQNRWGEELERLPKTLMEMLGVPLDAFNLKDAAYRLHNLYKGYFLRLDEGRPVGAAQMAATSHTRLSFSEEETAAIARAAKAHGWTVTHMVDAARHMAYIDARRDYLESLRLLPRKESTQADFLVPIDTRRDMLPEYQSLPHGFAGNATSGFTTAVDVMDPYFIPAAQERELNPSKPAHELSQVRVLAYVTEELSKQYKKEAHENVLRTESVMPIVVLMGAFSPTYPSQDEAPEGFSSVGVVDRVLPPEFALQGHATPIEVRDWFVSLTMSQHRASLQFSFHVWSLHNRLEFSVVYTERFSKERTQSFLRSMRTTLLEFVSAFEEKGHALDIPTAAPTTLRDLSWSHRVGSWWRSWFA